MSQLDINNSMLEEILASIDKLPNNNYDYFKNWITAPSTNPLIIPNGVETIGDAAFRNSLGVYSLELPISLQTIGTQAFMGCTNLSGELDLKNVVRVKGAGFRGANKITSIITNKLEDIGDNAFRDLTLLTEVKLPGTVNAVRSMAFYNCTGLKTVTFEQLFKTFPNGTMGPDIFSGCTNLTDIYVYWDSTKVINAPWGAPVGCKIHYTDKTMQVASNNTLVTI